MFEYYICNGANEVIYEKQCLAIEKNIPGVIKEDLLVDVDNSKIQSYRVGNSLISVHYYYYMNGVYVKSEIDLEKIIK
ncbi:hypothetical protein [Bacillus sp. Cr_A10]|uniref:hypothetical protein n=1 Tax=Bacillus sp. Cr_A10 TaxID=3033993 RepID=UPI0023D9D3D8|nr:hypothetical protein [Bacillus sp. Cr_A10]MDF2068019.1 hypothetical protein [Bacillus sp. Cr_A10]